MLKENLIRIYEKSFRDNHARMALSDYLTKENYSYLEMAQEIAKLHLLFEKYGVEAGDKVALVGRNSVRWVITYMATITYGAVIVPILQDFRAEDMNHIIEHSESKLLFLHDNYWAGIEQEKLPLLGAAFSLNDFSCIYEREGSECTEFQKEIEKHFAARYPNGFGVEDIKYPEVPNDRLCLLNYTSGTTGFSKGVMLTINNLTAQVVFMLPKKRHFPGSTTLSFLPLAHAYGCTVDMILSLAGGAHVTVLGKIPSPKILVEALQAVKPVYICSVPLILEKVIKTQVFPKFEKGVLKYAVKIPGLNKIVYSSIRKKLITTFGGNMKDFIVGGAALDPAVEDLLSKMNFPCPVGYGMTECAPLVSITLYEEGPKRRSVGQLMSLLEAKVDSPDPKNIPGELLLRGECVMMGYYKNPEVTAEVIDEDGWLHTGDMVTMDEENFIFIKGRCKTMLLGANGQNVYPEEIEAKISNIPYVLENLVIERDKKFYALIVPDFEQLKHDGVPAENVQGMMESAIKEVNKQIHAYEQLAGVILRDEEFEKTPKKSIKRFLYN